ncbi:MAG TPA: hypothetical protein DIT64_03065, partial [Verrucomicrobiales bacterium]|nr:hypothetical protein [Verrucomicrobiales bacterium]
MLAVCGKRLASRWHYLCPAINVSYLQSLQASAPVAHDILLFSIVILAGIGLGRVPFGGVRLGVAGVLFSGLLASHCGLEPDGKVAHFLKDFGLVLFVFALGLQMGPSFFGSLKKDGLRLNGWAAALVAGVAAVAVLGAWLLDLPLPAAAGLFAGATTNTPALGAAQQ